MTRKIQGQARDRGRSAATANRVLATLKHMLGLAVNRGSMDGELARRIRGVRLFKEPPGRVRSLSETEREALMKALSEQLPPIVLVALLTGMRLSEVLRIRVEHLDVSRRILHIEKTKNGRARRIPINHALAEILRPIVEMADTGWLFVTAKGPAAPKRQHQPGLPPGRDLRQGRGLPLPRPPTRLRHPAAA